MQLMLKVFYCKLITISYALHCVEFFYIVTCFLELKYPKQLIYM